MPAQNLVEKVVPALETSLAEGHGGMVLQPDDVVGVTFMLATGIMLASTVFFFLERSAVPYKWRPSMTVAGLVTGVAFWNYTFMREAWLEAHESPLVYRYCDWIITVPLQILEFYFILSAGGSGTGATFWNLLASSLAMLVFGYIGESGVCGHAMYFPMWFCGCLCWLYIVYYTFSGEAGALAAKGSAAQQSAFGTIRLIVSVGWIIYPIGYILGGVGLKNGLAWINGIYNIADLVNKTAFGLAIYAAAKTEVDGSSDGYQRLG